MVHTTTTTTTTTNNNNNNNNNNYYYYYYYYLQLYAVYLQFTHLKQTTFQLQIFIG